MSSHNELFTVQPIQPLVEMAAYESLWDQKNATFKTIAEFFRKNKGSIPSELVQETTFSEYLKIIKEIIAEYNVNICVYGSLEYPETLRDAKYPVEIFYYRGMLDLIHSPKRISIVGTRNPTEDGKKRARKLTRLLVEDGFTIISGLARGIDTIAHKTTIEMKGKTIGVIGTPITKNYPPENKELQEIIAKNFLLISQVPIVRYLKQNYKINRIFFPERNKTMSALSQATVIVEAGETSGTLIQARAAIEQGRKLFILDSCFNNNNITWPKRFEKMGAIRVKNYEDIRNGLK